ncbi:hypothetical protein A4D02_12365 [Niastella koreensis]|uniref:Uncharacterized protein n=1 Tax=Niastella koreensis TaxID=354356 RepID=A0ABX3NPJ1_9BACT|nr:hypothetical protein A4D02_12365 [Niastella koreensis]
MIISEFDNVLTQYEQVEKLFNNLKIKQFKYLIITLSNYHIITLVFGLFFFFLRLVQKLTIVNT